MSPKLARILWIPAAAAIAASGCASKQGSDADRGAVEQSSSADAKRPEAPIARTDQKTGIRDQFGKAKPATPVTPKEAPDDSVESEAEEQGAAAEAVFDKNQDRTPLADPQATGEPHKPGPASQPATKNKRERRAHGVGSASGRAPVASVRRAPPVDTVGSEDFKDYGTNKMTRSVEDKLSTFAVDVDTASYAIARRKILEGAVPPAAAVRVEEFVNYFNYDYAGPTDGGAFAVHMNAAPSPFTPNRHLLRVGVQAKKLSVRERKAAHLVFLVDVSGSMQSPDKLDLAKRSLRILVDNLRDGDTVALATYAGSTRVVLEPTGLERKAEIVSAIEELSAGGSTAMASGLELAYELAARNLKPESISRVIVLSDGDANVGNTTYEEMLRSIAGKVKEGVTLSTVGFGMGNYKDTMMEQLANKGNGNNYYIDSLSQAKRVFQEQLGGTLEVVAKDVKLQVEFDPEVVEAYRLVGYENRDIADVDFRNDKVDAGEIGAGHTVTAIYEVALGKKATGPLATVRIRAKTPRGTKAAEESYTFAREAMAGSFDGASADFRFATAVAATAEILRRSPYAAEWSLEKVSQIAAGASDAQNAERQEFLSLLERLRPLRSQLTAAR